MNVKRFGGISTIIIFFYLLAALIFFIFVSEPSLKGETSVRVGADSITYIQTARYYSEHSLKLSDVLSLSSNLLGPVAILILFNFNYVLIFLFNSALFLTCIHHTLKLFPSNKVLLIVFIIINPITLLSIATVNKEILGATGIILTLYYIRNKNIKYLIAAVILSFLARWQQLFFVILCIPYLKIIFTTGGKFRYMPYILILAVSFAYPFVDPYVGFTGSDQLETARSQLQQAGGFLAILNTLQKSFLYFIAFIPKLVLSLVGNLGRITDLTKAETWNDLYNSLLFFHQLCMLVILYLALIRQKIRFKNYIFQFILLYTIIYCTSLFISYRYFYPIYIPLAAISISGSRKQSRKYVSALEANDYSMYGNLQRRKIS